MRAKDELFFYRDKKFQENSESLWGIDLFVENTQTPETFSTFWDNIRGNQEKTSYANAQCKALKMIAIKNMVVEFKPNEGLYIRDKNDKDVYAVLDFRNSGNGELRGQVLADALNKYISSKENETAYDALNNLLHSHHNPTFFSQHAKRFLELTERAQAIAFKAIDTVLAWVDKLKPAQRYSQEEEQNKEEVRKRFFPKFLKELDNENIINLQDKLSSNDFTEQQYSRERDEAIQRLLIYRETLFDETDTLGINLKDKRKASKCHFSEQLIQALVETKPEPEQSFKDYIESCIQKAEENLTSEEVSDWPKGVFSHRLYDIVNKMKETEPETPEADEQQTLL
ncbi:Uncharacterised protein [Legionella lansingensis]|uniref:Uncharacterized protein n=2 Tax=Legionella lansingensis TaxID=45067 RepID=A0A0W0VKH9_9GAMM|nr:hypothetical protein Llan_1775 [Legionella lansingensis]SNV46254.1 Uncharacterised protein [Legionella lansingensis]